MEKYHYFIGFLLIASCFAKKYNDEDKPTWAKKDIRDYSDADLERWDDLPKKKVHNLSFSKMRFTFLVFTINGKKMKNRFQKTNCQNIFENLLL